MQINTVIDYNGQQKKEKYGFMVFFYFLYKQINEIGERIAEAITADCQDYLDCDDCHIKSCLIINLCALHERKIWWSMFILLDYETMWKITFG